MAVDGKWKITWNTQRGPREATIDLSIAGAALSGSFAGGQGGSQSLDEGSVDGDTVKFKVTAQGPQGPNPMTFQGKVEGVKIEGTITNNFGSNPFTGTRA